MGLVNLKCTNCGAILKLDDSKDAAICEHCGGAFVVEKAIQYFNVTNVINNTYIVGESDFVIPAGVLRQYKGESTVVNVPDNAKRSQCAWPNEVTEIYYPDSVESVNDKWPTNLEIIRLPEGMLALPEGAFQDRKRLKKVFLPKSLKSIGDKCFAGCTALEKIDLPEGLTTIGIEAFDHAGLTEIDIPRSVQEIGRSAFSHTMIRSIDVPGLRNRTSFICAGCEKLEKATLGRGMTTFGYGLFFDCRKLTAIKIPKGVTRVEKGLDFCDGLRKIFVPATVDKMDSYAFDGCKNAILYIELPKPKLGAPKGWDSKWSKDILRKKLAVKEVVWGVSEEEYDRLP